MTGTVDSTFPALFLGAEDLPAGLTRISDLRVGFSEAEDQAYSRHLGQNVGMARWQGADESLFRLLVDIRWLFPDARSATAYHLETLQAKAEGKPENSTAEKVGSDCRIYSYPSGQILAPAQDIFAKALGKEHPFARGLDAAIAKTPDDGFIYLFTVGPVAVKYFALLGSSKAAAATGKSAVQAVARRIISRLEAAFPMAAARKPMAWWKRLIS